MSKLRYLDLSGCENISDLALHSLASSPTHRLTHVITSSEFRKEKCGSLLGTKRKLKNDLVAIGDSGLFKAETRDCHEEVEREPVDIESTQKACHSKKGCCWGQFQTSSFDKSSIGIERETPVSVQTNGSICQNQMVSGNSSCKESCGEALSSESTKSEMSGKTHQGCSTQDVFSDQGCSQWSVSASFSDICCSGVQVMTTKSICNNAYADDPHACDLSYIYLDMLIQSDEFIVNPDPSRQIVSCGNMREVDPQQTDLSLASESKFILASDGYQTTNVLHQSQCSVNGGESIGSEKWELPSDSTDECERGDMTVLGAASSLEFLSLSGCYRVTSDGLR